MSGITNHNDIVEMARLDNKARLFMNALGGPLPGLQKSHLHRGAHVLQVACGPGAWALEIGKMRSHLRVTGIDTQVWYARNRAQEQGLSNATFQEVMDIGGPFPFPDESFDLISAYFMSKFLRRQRWPPFLAECLRLLRPGGKLCLTEFELAFANTFAFEELVRLFLQAMIIRGQSFSPSHRHLGLLCDLEVMMQEAGLTTWSFPYLINFSWGTPTHKEWVEDYILLSREVQPLIIQMGLATQEAVDALHQQQCAEMWSPSFRGIFPLLTVWGAKETT